MEKVIRGIKIAAYVAEIIVAGSVVIELVEKYGSRSKRKSAVSKVAVDNAATDN